MMKYFILVALIGLSFSIKGQTRRANYGLNLYLENKKILKSENKKINIIFYNNSSDTLNVPVDNFYLRECLEIKFYVQGLLIDSDCGKEYKKAVVINDTVYRCDDFKLLQILPFQFRVYQHDLDDCSVFENNIEYQYQVKLSIQFDAKVICSNIWSGLQYSSLGSFEIKN